MTPLRFAYTCPRCAAAGEPRRVIKDREPPEPPRCPEHRVRMDRQANKPYRGARP